MQTLVNSNISNGEDIDNDVYFGYVIAIQKTYIIYRYLLPIYIIYTQSVLYVFTILYQVRKYQNITIITNSNKYQLLYLFELNYIKCHSLLLNF